MKKIIVLFSLIIVSISVFAQKNYIKELLISDEIRFRNPVFVDETDLNDEEFKIANRWKNFIAPEKYLQNSKKIIADTANIFHLNYDSLNFDSFFLMSFNLTTSRFAEISLRVETTMPMQIFVNGELAATKNTIQDSLSKKVLPMRYELTATPASYDVVLKMLVPNEEKNTQKFADVRVYFEADSALLNHIAISPEKPLRTYTIEDVLSTPRPYSVSISPNGKYAIIGNSTPQKNATNYSAEIINLENNKTIYRNAFVNYLRWMPKSNLLYYTQTTADGKRQLVTMNPETFQENILVENLPEGNFFVSPAENYLIFYSDEKPNYSEPNGFHHILSPRDRIPNSRKRTEFWLFDIKKQTKQQLFFGSRRMYLSDISADDSKILLTVYDDDFSAPPFLKKSVFMLDVETQNLDTILYKKSYGSSPIFSPDASQLLFIDSPEAFEQCGKSPKVKGIANDYDKQAFIYTLKTKQIEPITLDFAPSIQDATWSKSDNQIYFQVTECDTEVVYKYNPKKQTFTKIDLGNEIVTNFEVANYAPVAVSISQGASSYSIVHKIDLKSLKSQQIFDPQPHFKNKIQLGELKPFKFKSSFGDEIDGRVYFPPNFDSTKKYPLIVYYYGGTTPVARWFDSRYPFHAYAALGYVVYVLQPSGCIGYGQEFSARHVNAWGKQTADEIIEGTREFCRQHPFIDDKKIGCLGASYGGFMTMYLQTQTDIFAAAIAHAGISDISSYWGEGFWGYSYNGVAAANSYPWSNPELFNKQSPLTMADKINTPLLLLHGNADTNVPVGESIQMFNALRILNKTVELVTIDGENHHIIAPAKRLRWQHTIFAFFAKYLQDDPSWWNHLYPLK